MLQIFTYSNRALLENSGIRIGIVHATLDVVIVVGLLAALQQPFLLVLSD